MKARYFLIVGLGAGYLLGARAGRERYEQIRDKAKELWESPQVTRRREETVAYAKKQAPVIKAKAESAAKAAPGVIADGARAVAGAANDAAESTANAAWTAVHKASDTAKDVAHSVSATAKDVAAKVRRD